MEQINNQTVDNNAVFNEEEQSSFNIMEWILRFLKYWYLFLFGVVIAMCLGYYQNLSWSPQYTSESRILLIETTNSISFMQGFSSSPAGNNKRDINQVMLLQSYDLIGKTVDSMPSLKIDYEVRRRFTTRFLYCASPIDIEIMSLNDKAYLYTYCFTQKSDSSFTINILQKNEIIKKLNGKYNEPLGCDYFFIKIVPNKDFSYSEPVYFNFRNRESLVREFVGRLGISIIDKTSVIKMNLTSGNTDRDRDFLDHHAETFLADNLEKKNDEAVKTISFINEQLLYLADSLSSAEASLRAYRVQNNMYESGQFTSNLTKKMEMAEEKGKQLKIRDSYFIYLRNYLTKNISDGGIMSPTTIGISDPALLNFVTQYNKLQLERSEIGEKNPRYALLTSQMNDIKKYLFEMINSVNSIYEIDRKTYQKEIDEISQTLRDAPDKERKLLDYERKFNINDSYYTFLLQKRSEAQMRKAANSPDNSVLQKARVMYMVNGDVKKDIYSVRLIFGLLIPAIFIVLKELLNFTVRTGKDMDKLSKFPLIGSINHTKHQENEKIIASKYPNSVFVENLRVIRTKIELLLGRRKDFMILISSAESGDGKTYVAANLAGTFALQKKRTLLLDFDLRRPNLTHFLDSDNRKLGFVNYIIGDITLDEAIEHKTEYGIDFLSSGVVPPNPGEFCRLTKLQEMFSELRQRYDYIIIDTSPLGLVADAYNIMPFCDICLMIARSMKTNKSSFKELMKQLHFDKMKNIYVILNDLDRKKLGYARYGYGKYGYGGYGGYGSYGSYGYYASNYYARDYFEQDEVSVFQQIMQKIKNIFKRFLVR
ncbi:MAG: polysaccharide biosynthesis tyrosine autokinase [Prevotellaceae bacterium]|jgi:capsular exopolysaccharide synthesis family protein|nr:polysaccharide biosynthesis tyrosine autokinase [Prevotellaceae bacterium]